MTCGLPRCRGVYLLAVSIDEELLIHYGSRTARIPAGTYIYVGSAMGRGGVAGRLLRHSRKNKEVHWHIDSITTSPHASVFMASYLCMVDADAESRLASACSRVLKPGPPGFGCSDKPRDKTHLYRVTGKRSPAYFMEKCFTDAFGRRPSILRLDTGIHKL